MLLFAKTLAQKNRVSGLNQRLLLVERFACELLFEVLMINPSTCS